jgi:hypothetical protein
MDLRTGDIILYGKTNLTKLLVLGCAEIEGGVQIRIVDPKNKYSCKNKPLDLTKCYILHKAPRKSLTPPPETSIIKVEPQEIDFNETFDKVSYWVGNQVSFEAEDGIILEGLVVDRGSLWTENPSKKDDYTPIKYLTISEIGYPNKTWKVPLSRVK